MKIKIGRYEIEKGDIKLLFYCLRLRKRYINNSLNSIELDYIKNDILSLENLYEGVSNEKIFRIIQLH